jgi:hypothetical protein
VTAVAPDGAATVSPGTGAPVAKTVSGALAADSSITSGTLDPNVLMNAQDPFAVPAEAGPGEVTGANATGEAPPKPLRNPKR